MRFPDFTSWRTSLTGAGALVYAVADLVVMFHNNEWDSTRLGMAVMAILTGLGLISARDSAASVQAHAVQSVEIAKTNATAEVAAVKADALAVTVERNSEKAPC